MWRWAALAIALLALLVLLLTARRAPPKQIAQATPAHNFVVSRVPGAYAPLHTAARHAEAHAAHAALVDELCGMKGSNLRRAAGETIGQHVMRVTRAVISSWTGALVASGDPRRQAIGLALENARPGAPGRGPNDNSVTNNLVLLAVETNDPVIYALALSQCRDLDDASGPCQALSWEHWADIDPDNAVPWLGVAAEASSSGDRQGVDHALAKAAQASRFDEYASTVSQIALSALPRDITPLDKAVAGADVMSNLITGSPPTMGITATLCTDTAVQQPERKRQCTLIANDLAEKGSTLFDVMVARILAKRLGFPTARQTELQREDRNDTMALTAHNPWSYTNEGSGFRLGSHNFRCNTVLGYDELVDAVQAADGNWRAAFAAGPPTVPIAN
jgi:hypothetical protein